jgi:transmembrane sensor
LANKVLISVDHGRVQVDTGSFRNRQSLVLEDSQVAEVTLADDDKPAILKTVDRKAADAFSFERGVLMFDQADLAEIAETLSRYRKTPVRVRSGKPGAASPRIVAGIHADDVESFIDMLPRLAPVTVSREGDQVWLGMR